MNEKFIRSALLLGDDFLNKLSDKHIAVFGVGGVGGYVVETLIRCGIEHISLFDNDIVSLSNINRQIIALNSTIGKSKVEVLKQRILDINENVKVDIYQMFVDKNNIDKIDFTSFDYVIDAVDTVSTKLLIIEKCINNNVDIISSMGTGNKISSEGLEITDISKTSYCPLAKVMRKELKKRNIFHVNVLSSKVPPIKVVSNSCNGRHAPGSVSFIPSIGGIKIAEFVIKDILNN